MRKMLLTALLLGGAGFGAAYMLMATAEASAAEAKPAIRFSTGSSVPAVISTAAAPAAARVTPAGNIAMPANAPCALARGTPQVSSLPAIVYAPHGRQPQVLPPGVIAQSAQIQRFSDRRFRFSFFNNSVIPNQSIPRPVNIVP